MKLYTVVKTPDGRQGIYLGSFWQGRGSGVTGHDHVIFGDQSEWHFPTDSLKRAGIKLGYDAESRKYGPGDAYWQSVLKRHDIIRVALGCVSHLKLYIERQTKPDCFSDEEGLWGAVMESWTTAHWGAMYPQWGIRWAWRVLFQDDLPENIEELAAVHEVDHDERWACRRKVLAQQQEREIYEHSLKRAEAGGPAVQTRMM